MDKMKMELVWHNCRTCPPEEAHNDCLYITNGDGVFEVEWDNGYWLDYDGCIIRNIDKHAMSFGGQILTRPQQSFLNLSVCLSRHFYNKTIFFKR